MKIILNGICGYMGRETEKLLTSNYRGSSLAFGVDAFSNGSESSTVYRTWNDIPSSGDADCVIDFSHHSATKAMLDYAVSHNIPAVIATTGHTEDELVCIHDAAKKIPIFFSANMSLGVALLVELAKTAALAMPDAEIEIIEKHHDRKLDAPSGTALMIANSICEVRPEAYINTGRSGQGKRTPDEIGIHAVRMGNIVGEHEVIIGTQNQTISLKHEAHSRALFAEGAIAAAAFLCKCEAGLYDMKSLIGGK